MTEKLFELMQSNQVLSLILIFALIVIILFLFKKEIVDFIRKKYDLYNREEITNALSRASEERIFYSKTSDKLTPDIQERVLKFLKRKQ